LWQSKDQKGKKNGSRYGLAARWFPGAAVSGIDSGAASPAG